MNGITFIPVNKISPESEFKLKKLIEKQKMNLEKIKEQAIKELKIKQ